jgi:hypothetical protein
MKMLEERTYGATAMVEAIACRDFVHGAEAVAKMHSPTTALRSA